MVAFHQKNYEFSSKIAGQLSNNRYLFNKNWEFDHQINLEDSQRGWIYCNNGEEVSNVFVVPEAAASQKCSTQDNVRKNPGEKRY